jgi:Sec-independent protein translocase protein TatA
MQYAHWLIVAGAVLVVLGLSALHCIKTTLSRLTVI